MLQGTGIKETFCSEANKASHGPSSSSKDCSLTFTASRLPALSGKETDGPKNESLFPLLGILKGLGGEWTIKCVRNEAEKKRYSEKVVHWQYKSKDNMKCVIFYNIIVQPSIIYHRLYCAG